MVALLLSDLNMKKYFPQVEQLISIVLSVILKTVCKLSVEQNGHFAFCFGVSVAVVGIVITRE